ncbi:MAG: response regulator transcription factor [Candidatus Kapabacteria bacterium]|nr:response regulator transcription factor [Candidatus Kapabacteria bacterium]
MSKILVIEDDAAISIGLEVVLKDEGYEVTTESDGETGYFKAMSRQYDMIILDVMLPSKNGFEICKDLRLNKVTTPILFLSSKKEEFDKIIGFENGADDYLTKPFSIIELKLRIKAILNRIKPQPAETKSHDEIIKFDDYVMIPSKYDVFLNDKPLGLSVKEFQFLKLLIEKKGDVISRDEVLDKVWGYDNFPTTRTVDNYILSLRKKIEPDPANPKYVLTVHTIGYKFNG